MRQRFVNPWPSEEALADAVKAELRSLGWVVHPETAGFDLLAVADFEEHTWVKRGDTLGIETKLDAGTLAGWTSLLRQIVPPRWGVASLRGPEDEGKPKAGPNFRLAVSARFPADGYRFLMGQGINALTAGQEDRRIFYSRWSPQFRRAPAEPIAPPDIVVDVPAGVPSPQTSSAWKVAAVKVTLALCNGGLTSKEIEAMGCGISYFREQCWIRDSGRRRGRAYVWEADDSPAHRYATVQKRPLPDKQWPEIAEALAAQEAGR